MDRRKFLASLGAVSMVGIAGCSDSTAKERDISWEESGLIPSETDTVKTISAYVVARNESNKEKDFLVDIRVARNDGTLLTNWRRVSIGDVPPGDKAMLEETFEVSRSSWFSNTDPATVEESAIVLFRHKKSLSDDDGVPLYFDDGEVKEFTPTNS